MGTEILKNESRTLRIFENLAYGNLKNESETYEFLEIWCMGILKNEFESGTYEFLEIWCMGFLKNECGIFGVFGKFWYENFFFFFKWTRNFWKLGYENF